MKNSLVALFLIIAVLASGVAGYALATRGTTDITGNSSTTTIFITRSVMVTNTSSTTSACTSTGGLGCPHFFNQTFIISVDYSGPWGLSYQGYLGTGTSGSLIEAGNFFGHGSTNESITVSGTDTSGVTACVEAQKLDASSSVLILKLPTSNTVNQTSLPYGTAKLCMAYAIV